MSEPDDDRDGLAAEYVLGTLDPSERLAAEGRRVNDAGFDGLVRVHERRLTPLLIAVEPVDPPAALEERVMTAIAATAAAPASEVVAMRASLGRWRGAAGGFATLAAALAIAFVLPKAPIATKGSFVAVLQTPGVDPAYVAQVDLDTGTVSVRRIAAVATQARSHELWILGGGRAAPVSLGVVDASAKIPITRLGGKADAHLDESSFAITLEPTGGSPTGKPTGPVLWSGKLTPTE